MKHLLVLSRLNFSPYNLLASFCFSLFGLSSKLSNSFLCNSWISFNMNLQGTKEVFFSENTGMPAQWGAIVIYHINPLYIIVIYSANPAWSVRVCSWWLRNIAFMLAERSLPWQLVTFCVLRIFSGALSSFLILFWWCELNFNRVQHMRIRGEQCNTHVFDWVRGAKHPTTISEPSRGTSP